jgi:dipeptidase E
MGGGGFSMEPNNPLLDDFVLSLSRRQPPRVCFLPTASGDSATYIAKFYRAFSGRCAPTDLTLIGSPALPRRPAHTRELMEFVREQDVFYVGGGNTANLLALWRLHGLDIVLRDAWNAGAVFAGLSAGMICWFSASITDSFGGLDPFSDGLGWLPGSACPHYDGEIGRRPAFHAAIANGLPDGYAADDGAALHFVAGEFVEAISSRPKARAYRVRRQGLEVLEEILPTRFLGDT